MRINTGRAVVAGVTGALVMTTVGLWAAPMMGITRMNPADMLAQQMGGNTALGWAGHLMIGTILALSYAAISRRLPGPHAIRGAIFSLLPFFMAQLLVMPMMGLPLFSGSLPLALGSLIGHVIYGLVIGAVYGSGGQTSAARRPIAA